MWWWHLLGVELCKQRNAKFAIKIPKLFDSHNFPIVHIDESFFIKPLEMWLHLPILSQSAGLILKSSASAEDFCSEYLAVECDWRLELMTAKPWCRCCNPWKCRGDRWRCCCLNCHFPSLISTPFFIRDFLLSLHKLSYQIFFWLSDLLFFGFR